MSRVPPTHYPGYDVLNKRNSPSWDDPTRAVIDERMSPPAEPRFFNAVEWIAAKALCARIMPQPSGRAAIPLAELLDDKLTKNEGDGYRDARLYPLREAWRIGLKALDDESRAAHELPFASLGDDDAQTFLEAMQRGEMNSPSWQGMPAALFFSKRVVHDICGLYYSHPYSWSEIGFGGPANPRGYVRMYFDRRDPWEPAEEKPEDGGKARKENARVR